MSVDAVNRLFNSASTHHGAKPTDISHNTRIPGVIVSI